MKGEGDIINIMSVEQVNPNLREELDNLQGDMIEIAAQLEQTAWWRKFEYIRDNLYRWKDRVALVAEGFLPLPEFTLPTQTFETIQTQLEQLASLRDRGLLDQTENPELPYSYYFAIIFSGQTGRKYSPLRNAFFDFFTTRKPYPTAFLGEVLPIERVSHPFPISDLWHLIQADALSPDALKEADKFFERLTDILLNEWYRISRRSKTDDVTRIQKARILSAFLNLNAVMLYTPPYTTISGTQTPILPVTRNRVLRFTRGLFDSFSLKHND